LAEGIDSKTYDIATKNQDLIFHEAAFVSAAQSCEKPYECYEINVHGTLNILDAANKNKVEKLLFESSAYNLWRWVANARFCTREQSGKYLFN